MSRLLVSGLASLAALLGSSVALGAAPAAANYRQISVGGAPIAPVRKPGHAPESWGCTLDKASGLTWEVKSDDSGLRDARWTYWPHQGDAAPDAKVIGYRGAAGGQCVRALMEGQSCDTAAYVKAVNAARLCGHADWRLPTARELTRFSSDHAGMSLALRQRSFPHVVPGWYWTSTTESGGVHYTRVILLPQRASPLVFDGTYSVILVRDSGKAAKAP